MRAVSLVPSVTETLFDLGAGDSVVGVTDFCIFPESIDAVAVGGTKNPNVARIRKLAPDVVHMNFEENLRRHADEIATFSRLHVTEPKGVDDVRALILELGSMYDRDDRAKELVAQLDTIRAAMSRKQFTFACAIWKKPWMWCGGDTYVSSLVSEAGGKNVLGHQKRYPTMDLDCIASLEPQVIFLPDEPFVFTDDDAKEVGSATGARVIGPFPGHLFTWHGTRTIRGLEFLSISTSSR